MGKNTTRLFADPGFDHRTGEDVSGSVFLPDEMGLALNDEKVLLSPTADPLLAKPSIDTRLREALKPVIGNINVLKPYMYYRLLKETHAALIKRAGDEKSGDARETFKELVSLLEENLALYSLLEHFMNNVRKA